MSLYRTDSMDITMRIICHGRLTPDILTSLADGTLPKSSTAEPQSGKREHDNDEDEDMASVSDELNANGLVKAVDIVQVTRSNNADYLSTLDVHLHTPISSMNLRQLFFRQLNHPIIGNSSYTKPLKSNRDKGLCMSIMRIRLAHPATGQDMSWNASEPDKFELLRSREQKFWRRRLDQRLEEMRKAGVAMAGTEEGLDAIEASQKEKPLAYVLGEKVNSE